MGSLGCVKGVEQSTGPVTEQWLHKLSDLLGLRRSEPWQEPFQMVVKQRKGTAKSSHASAATPVLLACSNLKSHHNSCPCLMWLVHCWARSLESLLFRAGAEQEAESGETALLLHGDDDLACGLALEHMVEGFIYLQTQSPKCLW